MPCTVTLGRLSCTRQDPHVRGHWFVGADVPDRHDDGAE